MDVLIMNKLSKKSIFDKIDEAVLYEDKHPFLVYGPQFIGKTFSMKNIIKKYYEDQHRYYVEYIDCNAISA